MTEDSPLKKWASSKTKGGSGQMFEGKPVALKGPSSDWGTVLVSSKHVPITIFRRKNEENARKTAEESMGRDTVVRLVGNEWKRA